MDLIADNAFHIEKSECYTTLKDSSIKSVECIRAKGDNLVFIEAKSSFPNPNKPDSIEKFRSNINDICDKFVHSLNLYASIIIGVNEQHLPDFEPAAKVSLKLVVILNDFEKGWCNQIRKALTNKLKQSNYIVKIWRPEVFALNSEDAAAQNFIK
jgi:hypothetical protein